MIRRLSISDAARVVAKKFSRKNVKTVSIDIETHPEMKNYSWKVIEKNVEQYNFDEDLGKVDFILLLDIIDHLKSPERLLHVLKERFSKDCPECEKTKIDDTTSQRKKKRFPDKNL